MIGHSMGSAHGHFWVWTWDNTKGNNCAPNNMDLPAVLFVAAAASAQHSHAASAAAAVAVAAVAGPAAADSAALTVAPALPWCSGWSASAASADCRSASSWLRLPASHAALRPAALLSPIPASCWVCGRQQARLMPQFVSLHNGTTTGSVCRRSISVCQQSLYASVPSPGVEQVIFAGSFKAPARLVFSAVQAASHVNGGR